MNDRLASSAGKVREALAARGLSCSVHELPSSTRTAAEAASTIGCALGQIVKSVLFIGNSSSTPILVLASGVNRVNEGIVGGFAGEPIRKARPDEVRMHTGFAIGGVAPIGHPSELKTLIDRDLLGYNEVWAAAGTPNAVFSIKPRDLVEATTGLVTDVAVRSVDA